MGKYRKRAEIVEAEQWFVNGDHSEDPCYPEDGAIEGALVRYYRNPDDSGERLCGHCQHTMGEHGWIDTLEGGHIVCPGDWIVDGEHGLHIGFYPIHSDIFEATYREADEGWPLRLMQTEDFLHAERVKNAALRAYVRHKPDCACAVVSEVNDFPVPCTCGLDEALQAGDGREINDATLHQGRA